MFISINILSVHNQPSIPSAQAHRLQMQTPPKKAIDPYLNSILSSPSSPLPLPPPIPKPTLEAAHHKSQITNPPSLNMDPAAPSPLVPHQHRPREIPLQLSALQALPLPNRLTNYYVDFQSTIYKLGRNVKAFL